MSYPALFTTPGLKTFAENVDAERSRQLRKFGDQHHPDGTGLPVYRHSANRYRAQADRNAASGVLAWRDVLLEEVHEALAESDRALLRAELVQVAAVCAAWISDLDRRPADGEQPRTVGMDPVHILGIDPGRSRHGRDDQADDRVVAYLTTDGALLCREHGDGWAGLTPLASEDLPDGGICTWGRPGPDECGRDVLA